MWASLRGMDGQDTALSPSRSHATVTISLPRAAVKQNRSVPDDDDGFEGEDDRWMTRRGFVARVIFEPPEMHRTSRQRSNRRIGRSRTPTGGKGSSDQFRLRSPFGET